MGIDRVVRTSVVALVAAATFVGLSPAAQAAPRGALTADLAALWTTVLETPSAQNSFGTGGDAYACWDIRVGRTIAPSSPTPGGVPSCTVRPGTWLFITGYSVECSTWESDCTLDDGSAVPTVTLDGRPVPLAELLTGPRPVTLPAGNLFEQPAGSQGQFIAHGWVTLVHPLPPGRHIITIDRGAAPEIRTTIDVQLPRS